MILLNKQLTQNSIYKGRVFHYRKKPKKNCFKYKVFYLYFDILKAEAIFKRIPFISLDKFNLFSFYSKDHGPSGEVSLINWIKTTLKRNNINDRIANIFLLTYPRYLGYVFNPLSVYTCFGINGKILAQIYEVHNTFKQRHFYLIKNTYDKKNHSLKVKKAFHVSPFMSMKGSYSFKSFSRRDNISIFINYTSENENLIASFTGKSKRLDSLNLIKEFFLLPFMTFKIILGIHFEAIILFLKGIKFHKCPKQNKNDLTN